MLYCEVISGLWIGDLSIMYNKGFLSDNNISVVINCTINHNFPDVLNKIRIPLSDNFQRSIDTIQTYKDKITTFIFNNIDEHNILIACHDGHNISPYLASLFLLKYTDGKISKQNVKKIIKSKHDNISMDFDLSVYN